MGGRVESGKGKPGLVAVSPGCVMSARAAPARIAGMQTQAEAPHPPAPPPPPGGWKRALGTVLRTLIFGAMLAGMGLYVLPDLIADWRIRATAVPVAGARVDNGSCSSKLVLHICDATLTVPGKPRALSRHVNYVFADLHWGGYTVHVLADPAHPELPTTSLALDRIWSRTLTLLVAGGMLLALVLGPAIALFRRR